MEVKEFYDLLKVLRARLATFGQTWDVVEIEGNEAFVENVEVYDHVLDFYELVKTNQPKMFTETLNKCILAVQKNGWKALNLTDEEVAKQLAYHLKKDNMSKVLKSGVTQEVEPVKISNKQKKREDREKMLQKRHKKKKTFSKFNEKEKQKKVFKANKGKSASKFKDKKGPK